MKKNNDNLGLAYMDFDGFFDSLFGEGEPIGEPNETERVKEPSKILRLMSLGWNDEGYNGFGRREFSLGDYGLFEHLGDIGIINGDTFEYCDLTGDEIEKYTRMVRKIIEIDNHDDCYTLYDYRLAMEELKNYTETLIDKD